MKVGIMSMQRIINYGSFLQAYALKKTIESMGHDVEFVDYHIGEPIVSPIYDNSVQNSILKRVLRIVFSNAYRNKRKNERMQNESYGIFYEKFKSDWIPLLGITENKNYNPDLDALVIGSDEVFNCTQSNSDVGYSPELFGVNSHAKKIITYAASFGSTTFEKLVRYGKTKEIALYLNNLDAISVRDKNSYDIVKKLTGIDPISNVDPVFIYEFEKEVPEKVDLHDYVIVYAYSGRITNEEADAIQKFAHNNGKKTLSLGVMQAFTDEYRCVSPFELLAYFRNADYVVTDTFHGTVFSIKYHVPFLTFIRESNCEKLSDLLKKFDLQYRAGSVRETDKILKKALDDVSIDNYIHKYTQEAKNSLQIL